MRRNAYLRASGQKSDLAIRSGDLDFLLQENNSSVGIHFRYVLAISLVRIGDVPNIRFVFASLTNISPNSTFVFGRMVSSERIRIVSLYCTAI